MTPRDLYEDSDGDGGSLTQKPSRVSFDDVESNASLPRFQPRLLTWLMWNKKVPPIPLQSERTNIPVHSASFVSRVFIFWLTPLLYVGYRRTVTQQDLWTLGDDMSINHTYSVFKNNLDDIEKRHLAKNPDSLKKWPDHALSKAIWKTFNADLRWCLILAAMQGILSTLTPLLTKYLIRAVQNQDMNKGIGFAVGVSIMLCLSGMANIHAMKLAGIASVHVSGVLTKAILDKSLTADSETRHRYTGGFIMNLTGSDLERISEAFYGSVGLGSLPFAFVIGITLLCINLHASALVGIAVFLLVIGATGAPAKQFSQYREDINVITDKRAALIRQILQSMQMVKFYSWEDAYEKGVQTIRSQEISILYKMQLIIAVVFSNIIAATGITAMGAFLVSYAVNGMKGADVIFSSLALFGILTQSVTEAATNIPEFISAYKSINRISNYIGSPNETNDLDNFFDPTSDPSDRVALRINDGTFYWDEFSEADTTEKDTTEEDKEKNITDLSLSDIIKTQMTVLHDVNLSIEPGEFVVITGLTGSGKSSLLAAMAGFIGKAQGTVSKNGSILLCGAPTVLNDTIKSNILFGEQYDSKRYKEVLDVCALESDLAMFQARDMTEVGERGVTLSGGQKARINLARAVYRYRDIYLFDDVISAVDANVGNHIIDKCMMGYLEGKTRVLATHNLAVIQRADRVIFVNGDKSIQIGTEAELLESNQEFKQLMVHKNEVVERPVDWNMEQIDAVAVPVSVNLNPDHNPDSDNDGILVQDEERAVNSIPLSMYFDYFSVGRGRLGFLVLPVIIVFGALSSFADIFTNVWLSYWLENKFNNLSSGAYIGIYVMFTLLAWILLCVELGIFGIALAHSAKVLHLDSLHRVLHTPMSFMDSTPIGRIMNRFTKDTNSLDNSLPLHLRVIVHVSINCIGILILAIIYVPWFAIAIPFLIVGLIILCNYFQATGREVKRLEAINRSFVMSNMNEVLNGVDTIRAYGSQDMFRSKNDMLIDQLNEVSFVNAINRRWISLSLIILAAFSVLIITLFCATRVFSISPSAAGLLTNYMIQFANLISVILGIYTMVENEMNSVERTYHYARELVQEAPYRKNDTQPAPEWPQTGSIKFEKVSLRYREGLPLVIKNLSIEVGQAEKIGICGRTGAGKSSLMNILFRISELESGTITIDGVDISKLGLYELRSKLAIIPQDPVLFQGTIKSNLDPFNEKSEDELWEALRRGGLIQNVDDVKDASDIKAHKFHLNAVVEDEGSNFSLGERQLIALTRALVRRSKILVMDEATSSVDFETDALIQATIAREFTDCTILCIAHRLKTILKYDRVLVLEKGELDEFDKPHRLFSKGGRFREMCTSAGITEVDFQ